MYQKFFVPTQKHLIQLPVSNLPMIQILIIMFLVIADLLAITISLYLIIKKSICYILHFI